MEKEIEEMLYKLYDVVKTPHDDIMVLPFGNSKKRQKIYRKGVSVESLDECMESNIVICKSASFRLIYDTGI